MTLTLHPGGRFSLTAAATFIEGFHVTEAERPPDALRYAWAVDGDWRTVQATLRQDENGRPNEDSPLERATSYERSRSLPKTAGSPANGSAR